uniref:Transmembrane protein n=1 Tax=Strongyloides venezuelensis TaxID=75913 RepID=A0A0K0FK16_STRVS
MGNSCNLSNFAFHGTKTNLFWKNWRSICVFVLKVSSRDCAISLACERCEWDVVRSGYIRFLECLLNIASCYVGKLSSLWIMNAHMFVRLNVAYRKCLKRSSPAITCFHTYFFTHILSQPLSLLIFQCFGVALCQSHYHWSIHNARPFLFFRFLPIFLLVYFNVVFSEIF